MSGTSTFSAIPEGVSPALTVYVFAFFFLPFFFLPSLPAGCDDEVGEPLFEVPGSSFSAVERTRKRATPKATSASGARKRAGCVPSAR